MRVQKFFEGSVSRTKQSFRDECDINNIMAKYMATGLVDHVKKYQGRYEDLPNEIDYHENLNAVMRAEDAFSSLPSKIRTRFGNNPAAFLGFVLNPDNLEEVQRMGLGADQPGVNASDAAAAAPAPDVTAEPPSTAEGDPAQ